MFVPETFGSLCSLGIVQNVTGFGFFFSGTKALTIVYVLWSKWFMGGLGSNVKWLVGPYVNFFLKNLSFG